MPRRTRGFGRVGDANHGGRYLVTPQLSGRPVPRARSRDVRPASHNESKRILPGGEKVSRTELNPVDLLERAAFVYPDKVALVHGERRYTYAALGERAWRLANALRDVGLEKGDRVATLLPNSPAMLEATSAPAAGHPRHRQHLPLERRNRLHPRALGLPNPAARRRARGARRWDRPRRRSRDPRGRHRHDRRSVRAARRRVAHRPVSRLEDEERRSRSTTPPAPPVARGVQFTYRGAYLNALDETIVAGLSRSRSPLAAADVPLQRLVLTWAVTAVGGRHLTIRTVDPDLIWDLVDAEGDQLQRRTDGAADGDQPRESTPRRASGDSGRRCAPPSPTSSRDGRAELPGRPRTA